MDEKQIFKYDLNGKEYVISNRYAGQRMIEIRKHNQKSGLTYQAIDIAIRTFGGASSEFALFAALGKNSHGYKLKVHTSKKEAERLGLKTILSESGISIQSYYKAFNALVKHGYLVSQPISFKGRTIHDEGTYYFYDIPPAILEKNEPSFYVNNAEDNIPTLDYLESLVKNK